MIVVPASAIEEMNATDAVSKAAFEVFDDAKEIAAPKPMTWREQLDKTIETIQAKIDSTVDVGDREQLQGKLQVLRLMPTELDQQQQQYMTALTELLQTTSAEGPADVYSTGQTLNKLRGAVSYLESIASMKIVNASFCTEVTGFGQFQATLSNVFKTGQTILVYCEIENHSSQLKNIDGRELRSTQLTGSYVVYDANKNVVQQEAFPTVEDLALQRRRDFYMHIPITIGELAPGKYTYQLMVDDVGGAKSASLEPVLQFEVR